MKKLLIILSLATQLFSYSGVNYQVMLSMAMIEANEIHENKSHTQDTTLTPHIKYLGITFGFIGIASTLLAFRPTPKKYINGKLNPRFKSI
jgi:hypothetical protein